MGIKYEAPLVSRRAALRGAAVGAAVVWVAPAVQVVSMTSAHAASGPPDRVRGTPPRGTKNNRGNGPKPKRGT
jgi:hypothetical protein